MRKSFYLVLVLLQILLCNNIVAAGTSFNLTSPLYGSDTDFQTAVQNELGEAYQVADWNDLKNFVDYGGDENTLQAFSNAMLTRDGLQKWSDDRQYYVYWSTRPGLPPSDSFYVHDNIGQLYLGSWSTLSERSILAKSEKPSNPKISQIVQILLLDDKVITDISALNGYWNLFLTPCGTTESTVYPINITQTGDSLSIKYAQGTNDGLSDATGTVEGNNVTMNFGGLIATGSIEDGLMTGTWDQNLFVCGSWEAKKVVPYPHSQANIVVDGNINDWNGIDPVAYSIEGCSETSCIEGSDLKSFRLACNGDTIYFLFETWNGIDNSRLVSYRLWFDNDIDGVFDGDPGDISVHVERDDGSIYMDFQDMGGFSKTVVDWTAVASGNYIEGSFNSAQAGISDVTYLKTGAAAIYFMGSFDRLRIGVFQLAQ